MTALHFRLKRAVVTTAFLLSAVGGFSQNYSYDANGSVSKIKDKQIASIKYNFLNLADTILFEDGRRIIYAYSATGLKISEQVIAADGRMIKKRDYINHCLYTNDTLREIRNDEGRTVPIVAADVSSSFDYQYHLSDHLGNVRTMLTSQPRIDDSKASLETSVHSEESNIFLRYQEARRVNAYLFDHTRNSETNFSQRLSGNVDEKYGLARSLSVMPGDTVKLEVFAKYVDPDVSNWTPLLNVLMTQVATHAVGLVEDGVMFNVSTSSFPFPDLENYGDGGGAAPRAYLNWIIFDRNFVFRNGGYMQVNESARENGSDVIHQQLFAEIPINEPGYVYAYLSNEETVPVDVYFDDFSVTQVKGPVVQQSDYDPFGLTFNEYSRENSAANDFLYNNKELQKDFDLNWYDYGARMYDAALGRWHVADPKVEKYFDWSPYNYVLNNPVIFVDPDGNDVQASKAFMASDYGPVFKDLYEKNSAYREIIGDYEGDKGTLTLSMVQTTEGSALATTDTGTEPFLSSEQSYLSNSSRKYRTQVFHLTEMGLAATIIHEAIHSETRDKDSKRHEKFNKHHDQFVRALKEYNQAHDLGYTENELEDLAYDGTDDTEDFQNYIKFMAAKHYNNTREKELKGFRLRIWDFIYAPEDEVKQNQDSHE